MLSSDTISIGIIALNPKKTVGIMNPKNKKNPAINAEL